MKIENAVNGNTPKSQSNQLDTEQELPICRCLILDDDPHDARLMSRMLADVSTINFSVFVAHNLDEARKLQNAVQFDVFLIDFWMGAETTISFVDEISSAHNEALTIMLSTFDETEFKEISKRAGAMHFISKNDLSTETLLGAISKAA